MPKPEKPEVVVIVGPTASGKSDLAVEVARRIDGEIISADSRQVYRGLDIGSGKITKRETRGARHHLLDVASPRGAAFSAARYRTLARRAARDILRRGKIPIIAGGTGLYIDSFLYDTIIPEVPPNKILREKLEKQSAESLFAKLKKLDPRRAENIDPKNKRRLIRALEIIKATGEPIPEREPGNRQVEQMIGKENSPYRAVKIGIWRESEDLEKRISARLTKNLKKGLLKEIQKLHKEGVSWKKMDGWGLEYRYASRHVRGLISREEMIQNIGKESWKYARRQMAWWRKDKSIKWFTAKK